MPEQDGAVFGSPACGDDTAADSPRRSWWRVAAAALVFLGLAVSAAVSVGSATAAPPAPIGRWVSAGAEVELDQGFACALVGGCDPTWLSDHKGAAVEVVCADASQQLKVRGYFGQGEDVWTGWTPANNVQIARVDPADVQHTRLTGSGPVHNKTAKRPHGEGATILRAATRPWLTFDPIALEVFRCVFMLLW